VNSRGEQDRRREKLDNDEIPWMTKKFAGKGCRRWKMVEGVIPVGDEEQKLLDVVDSWDETMEPDGFAIPTSLRTLGFFCSWVELPLPMHKRCQSLADRTPLLT
jgi:hypothetical protein